MTRTQVRFDLLATRPIRWVLRSRAFPVSLQAIALVALTFLAFVGFGVGTDASPADLMTLRKTNLATLVVWGLWWPAMITVAVPLGRVWCTVCPMELVNRLGEGLARRIGWPRARLGRLLRAGWMIVLVYLALQWLVAGWSIHRVPHYTALLLLSLAGGAFLTGLVFRGPRSFCKAFCPAGALLSVYGRNTTFQLEMRDPDTCRRCPTRDCIRADNRHRFDRRACPSLLRPFDREPSDGCVLCLQCAKVCPYDNVGLGIVAPEAPIRRDRLLRPSEAAFVMVALGFVSHEVIGEVPWLDGYFHVVAVALADAVPGVPFAWVEALWFLVLFPAVVWLVIAGVGRAVGYGGGLGTLLLAAATGAAPVLAVAHLAKAVAKVVSWGGYVPLALGDPQGFATLALIAGRSVPEPEPFLDLSFVGCVMLLFTVVVAWKVWLRTRVAGAGVAERVGLAGSAILFGAVLAVWSWPLS